MYFFETEFLCPKCRTKEMFYVYGRTDINEKIVIYSSKYMRAKNWIEDGNKVKVTMYCDKCHETSNAIYDFKGNKIEDWNLF